MIGDELARDLDALIAEAKAKAVTAPTPERRVGEAELAEIVAMEWDGLRPDELRRNLARDLLDERAANARLTAEVERLTKEKARASQMAFEEGAVWGFTRPTGAAIQAEAVRRYPLPTPAPEARRQEVAALREKRISSAHLEALARYARDEISTGRLAELLGVTLLDVMDLRNAVQSDAPPAPEGTDGK